jgi:Uma2 family endonuclease
VLLKPREDFYDSVMPTPADVLLLVEVADSSLEYDRDTKVPLYAGAGIFEYWLVNLVDDLILVYRDPTPSGYRSVQVLRSGDRIQPLAFPDITIAVSDVLRSRT